MNRLDRERRLLAAVGGSGPARSLPDDALTDPDPASGERWDRGQVLAHVAEMLPQRAQQAELIAAGRQAEFGRVSSDPDRIAAIERDRQRGPAAAAGRVDEGAAGLGPARPARRRRPGPHRPPPDPRRHTVRDRRPLRQVAHGGARRPARPALTLRERRRQAYLQGYERSCL